MRNRIPFQFTTCEDGSSTGTNRETLLHYSLPVTLPSRESQNAHGSFTLTADTPISTISLVNYDTDGWYAGCSARPPLG